MNDFRAAPNQLTFLRLCLVPFLVLAILDGHYRTAAMLFFLAGITDGLDGLLARLLHQRTLLGQYLDPVADKLLLSTLFLVLNHQGLISRRVTVLVFGRDLGILVVSAILYIGIGWRDFRPSIYGKANTLAQIIGLITVLIGQFFAPAWIRAIRSGSLDATMALTVVSGFHYAWRVARRLSVAETPPTTQA
jgi:cardiolipin synthase